MSLVAFDSNVLTAFLDANSKATPAFGDQLASIQLFIYARDITILPTVAVEAERISRGAKRTEHLKWIRYHFVEAPAPLEDVDLELRMRHLLEQHPQKDTDDCRIVAEAEGVGVDVLATCDKRLKRLQPFTTVRLLTPPEALVHLGIGVGAPPHRLPSKGHPLADATWWAL